MVCEKTKGMKAEAVSLNSSLLRGNPHKLLPIDRLTLLFSYSTKAGEDHLLTAHFRSVTAYAMNSKKKSTAIISSQLW
jgi:hypothetical protein